MTRKAQNARHNLLGFSGMLGGRIDHNSTSFIEARYGALRFQIEMLLTADGKLAADSMRTARYSFARAHAPDVMRARMKTLGRDRVFDTQHGSQRAILDVHLRSPEPGSFEGLPEHPRNGLRMISDLRGKQGLVVTIGAGITLAGNIRRSERCDHAWLLHGRDRIQTH